MGRIFISLLLCAVLVSCANSAQNMSNAGLTYHSDNTSIAAFQDSIIKEHPVWDATMKKKIYTHKIVVGMTKMMVVASLGLPIYIDSERVAGQTELRYSYSGRFLTHKSDFLHIDQTSPYELEPNKYVYLKNDKVTGVIKSH